jgi:hypothetical protein
MKNLPALSKGGRKTSGATPMHPRKNESESRQNQTAKPPRGEAVQSVQSHERQQRPVSKLRVRGIPAGIVSRLRRGQIDITAITRRDCHEAADEIEALALRLEGAYRACQSYERNAEIMRAEISTLRQAIPGQEAG